jgi:hypothetical protein
VPLYYFQPRSLFKSYAKDLSFPIFELVLQHRLPTPFAARQVPSQCYDLGRGRPTPILIRYLSKESNVSPLIQHGFWLKLKKGKREKKRFFLFSLQLCSLLVYLVKLN